jgi:hypothetical protein
VGSATILLLALAGPASADVPDGWSNPAPVNGLHFVLLFVGIPLVITLLILAFIYIPGVVRGESVAPAGTRTEDEWFGGRRDTAELEPAGRTGADEADVEHGSGGAGGTW